MLIYFISSILLFPTSLLLKGTGLIGEDEGIMFVAVAICNAMIATHMMIAAVQSGEYQISIELPLAWVRKTLLPFSDSAAQKKFRYYCISMLAKISNLNGQQPNINLDRVEAYFSQGLELNASQQQRAFSIFHKSLRSSQRFEDFVESFYQYFSRSPSMLTALIEVLLEFTSLKGSVTPAEEQMIVFAARSFGLSQSGYERIRAGFPDLYASWNERVREMFNDQSASHSDWEQGEVASSTFSHPHYSILGCTPSSSDQEVKSAYRKLALEHHPDRAVAAGLPEEFIKRANAKFRQIQEAYEAIMAERSL